MRVFPPEVFYLFIYFYKGKGVRNYIKKNGQKIFLETLYTHICKGIELSKGEEEIPRAEEEE